MMPKQFRIATDGMHYRIEMLTHTFWRKREKWVPANTHIITGVCEMVFDGELEAKAALEKLIRCLEVGGWKPVSEPIEVEWHVP